MHYLRTFVTPDGGSTMEVADVATSRMENYPGHPVDVSAITDAARVVRARAPVGWAPGWHTAPRRRYVVTLSGAAEIETSDGQKRVVRTGDVALFDDITGRGHHTRVLDEGPWETFVVDL